MSIYKLKDPFPNCTWKLCANLQYQNLANSLQAYFANVSDSSILNLNLTGGSLELGLSNNFSKTICYTAVVVKGKERPKEFCEIRYFYIFYFARFPVTIINLCPSCGGIRAPSTSSSQHSATVISHLGNTNCCTAIVHYSAVRTSTEYKQKISQCCISTICCYQCPLGAPLHSTVGRTNKPLPSLPLRSLSQYNPPPSANPCCGGGGGCGGGGSYYGLLHPTY